MSNSFDERVEKLAQLRKMQDKMWASPSENMPTLKLLAQTYKDNDSPANAEALEKRIKNWNDSNN